MAPKGGEERKKLLSFKTIGEKVSFPCHTAPVRRYHFQLKSHLLRSRNEIMLWISTWIYILGWLPVRLIYLKDWFFFFYERKKKKTLGDGVRAMMHGWNLRKHLPTSNSDEKTEWQNKGREREEKCQSFIISSYLTASYQEHRLLPSSSTSSQIVHSKLLAHFARPSTVIDLFFQLNKALLSLLLVNTQRPPIPHNIHSSYAGNIISLHAKLIPPLLLK